MQKLPWKTFNAYFVAYFVVFASAPSTRSSTLLTSAVVLLFLLSFLGLRWEEMVNPQIKTWKSFLHFNVRLMAWKWFEVVPGKHRKSDVATVFAYSHLNTLIDQ